MNKATKITVFALCSIMITAVISQTALAAPQQSLKAKDKAAKAKYQQVRAQYQKEVKTYKNTRQSLIKAKERYRKLKNAKNKKALEDQSRAFLEKAIKSLIKKLESVKTWVENKHGLTDTEKEVIISDINNDIEWLNNRLPKIQNATPTQIKEEAKKIREYWKNHKIKIKKITGKTLSHRIAYVIKKAETFSGKIEGRIEALNSNGVDTTNLEVWLGDFNKKLEIAKEKYEAAKNSFQSISSLSNTNNLFSEGHKFLKEADQYLREAHKILVKIVKEMKNIANNQ